MKFSEIYARNKSKAILNIVYAAFGIFYMSFFIIYNIINGISDVSDTIQIILSTISGLFFIILGISNIVSLGRNADINK